MKSEVTIHKYVSYGSMIEGMWGGDAVNGAVSLQAS